MTATPPPEGSAITVGFSATAPALDGLALTAATTDWTGFTVFGDVDPDGRAMPGDLHLSLLDAGPIVSLPDLPQGVYSRIRFTVAHITLSGTYQGYPLEIAIAGDGDGDEDDTSLVADLRAPTAIEISPGSPGAFQISLDGHAWLDSTELAPAAHDGAITIDATHNQPLEDLIDTRIVPSLSLK